MNGMRVDEFNPAEMVAALRRTQRVAGGYSLKKACELGRMSKEHFQSICRQLDIPDQSSYSKEDVARVIGACYNVECS